MKKIEKLYREAPVRHSPDSLDREILKQAELHVARKKFARSERPLLSSWMPIAASFVVVGFGLALVLRSGMMGNGGRSGNEAEPDGYRDIMSDSADADKSGTERIRGGKSELTDSYSNIGDSDQLVQLEESAPRENRLAKKREQSAPLVAEPQFKLDRLTGDRSSGSAQPDSLRQSRPIDSTAVATVEMQPVPPVHSDNLLEQMPSPQTRELQAPASQTPAPQTQVTDLSIAEAPAVETTSAESLAVESRAEAGSSNKSVFAGNDMDGDAAGLIETEITVADTGRQVLDRSAQLELAVSDESAVARIVAESAEESPLSVASNSLRNRQQGVASSLVSRDISAELRNQDRPTSNRVSKTLVESNSRQDAIILAGNGSTSWLNKQPSSFYTLQLATANDDDYLAEFAQRVVGDSQRQQQFAVLPLQSNSSKTLRYTLLAGTFSSFEDAKNALAQLPDRARQFGARVRNFGVLQETGK